MNPTPHEAGAHRLDSETGAIVVVPCYNEATRLDTEEFLRWARLGRVSFLFVDDGSSDDTREVLEQMQVRAQSGVSVHRLSANSGKAEAVRQGLLAALDRNASVVGYLDADLATPVPELLEMLAVLQAGDYSVVMGSRVKILGHQIERRWYRHLPGRIFATFASLVLGIAVMDTQCGAKLFRGGPLLRAVLRRPFRTRWAFDVELLGRLLAGAPGIPPLPHDQVVEFPLRTWTDIKGSKLRLAAMVWTTLSLARIWRDLREWRRESRGA